MKYITRTILLLSFVSLCTDLASEMLYPVMPIYLRTIGFSVLLIGILEGVAEATAGLSKGFFGNLSDVLGRRAPFVRLGYALSAVSKPMLALLTHPWWVFTARTTDRLGKGLRTGARDAILSAESRPEEKGRVFGFHRAFDTIGAALGPLVALVLLTLTPGDYTRLFLIAAIPGAAAVILTFFVRDRRTTSPVAGGTRPGFFAFLRYWRSAPASYRSLVGGLLVFGLVNSSDMLLLLMMNHQGATDRQVILIYVFYNMVYALSSFPMGMVGDRMGLRKTFQLGLGLFAVVYGAIGFVSSPVIMAVLFFLYGLYAASTEGISKAWIANIVPAGETATAIGFYTGMNSLCTLIASSAAGFLWYEVGPQAAFGVSAAGAAGVAVYLAWVFRSKGDSPTVMPHVPRS